MVTRISFIGLISRLHNLLYSLASEFTFETKEKVSCLLPGFRAETYKARVTEASCVLVQERVLAQRSVRQSFGHFVRRSCIVRKSLTQVQRFVFERELNELDPAAKANLVRC